MDHGGAQRSHLELLGAASAALAQPGDVQARLQETLALLVTDVCREVVLDIHGADDRHTLVSAQAAPEQSSGHRDAADQLVVPLRAGDHSLGVLFASHAHGPGFAHADRLLVELVAERIAIHLVAAGQNGAQPTPGHGATNGSAATLAAQEELGPEAMLLGIVSHDLRNPLGVVTMGASLLLAQELTDAQRRLVTKIDAAGRKASHLIADLLDFTAARGRGIELSPQSQDLHTLVAQAVDDLQTISPDRVIEHEQDGDATSRFDHARVEQIVTNLIGNALQHSTPPTKVLVETRGEPDAVVFSVTNYGRPIPDTIQQRLFAPLRRGENAGVRRGSIGLGLFIVHQLVLAHGGTIDVVSSEADGTRFTVRLPRALGSTPAAAHAPVPLV
jgi:signal transduction histidine kinase